MKLVRMIGGQRLSGIIVEVEAYLAENDPACHASRGITPRNQSMFMTCGILYVYAIHSRWCMNVVTEESGRGAAVLIRAVEPVEGLHLMRQERIVDRDVDLTNGPGKLCQAMRIDRLLDQSDLTQSEDIWIEEPSDRVEARVRISPRIGINVGVELPYRFYFDNHRYVSGRASDHSARRIIVFSS